jgi:hypothetical protein
VIALTIFAAYLSLILLANYLFKKSKETGKQVYDVTGGLVFLFAISAIGVIIPLYLIVIQCIDVQIWPENSFFAISLLTIFYFFQGTKCFQTSYQQKRDLEKSLSTFLGRSVCTSQVC